MPYQMPINRINPIRYSIAIDPDKVKSGFAVWDRVTGKVAQAIPLGFFDLCRKLDKIEVGSADFALDAGWLNPKANYHEVVLPDRLKKGGIDQAVRDKYTADVREHVANKVGLNAGVGHAIHEYLLGLGHKVRLVKPEMSKWDAEMIRRQTGYDKPANSDVRDAIRLAWVYK